MSDPGEVERVAAAIRAAWCEWARTQPNPKPSWLVPWDSLDEQSRDADRHLARWHLAALSLPAHGGAVSAATPRAEVGETSSDGPCRENDGCPTELAVLQRFWRSHQSLSHASRAEALEEAARAVVSLDVSDQRYPEAALARAYEVIRALAQKARGA